MFSAIVKGTNSSFQKSMTFCRGIYLKKVMKLLAFIFEHPSYELKIERQCRRTRILLSIIKIIFLISQSKYILWVLKSRAPMMHLNEKVFLSPQNMLTCFGCSKETYQDMFWVLKRIFLFRLS